MAYIEIAAPRDWGFCTLVGYPYVVAARNFKLAFSCTNSKETSSPSLAGRVAHFILGAILLIPLLNTIVFVALRLFFNLPICEDKTEILKAPKSPDERGTKIAELSANRNELFQKMRPLPDGDERRNLDRQIQELELEAAKTLQLKIPKNVARHLLYSRTRNPLLTKMDGKITAASKQTKIVLAKSQNLPEATFSQAPALTQLEGGNQLCGYYALFFMLQAATGGSFTDRANFYPILREWIKLIAIKRSAEWLCSKRHQEIPYGLRRPIYGLSPGEMRYLIQHSETLAPLRTKEGCFIMDLNEFYEGQSYSEPIQLLGQKQIPNKFPIYFVLKVGGHYYCTYAEEPGKFTCLHSMNYSMLNSACFSRSHFTAILQVLTGIKSSLRLSW